MDDKKEGDESDRASVHSRRLVPILSLLTTADAGRKSSSSLPDFVLTMRETIPPAATNREGLGAVGANGGGGA